MAKQKVYGFADQESARRTQEAVRGILGEQKTGSRRRRQSPVIDSRPFLGKANANIASRASGSVSVYSGTLGSESDTLKDITAFNITDQQADLGVWVEITRMQGGYAIKPLECPA